MAYANKAHIIPPMSLKFIFDLGLINVICD